MWMVFVPSVIRVGFCQRFVEGDQWRRVGGLKKHDIFKLAVSFEGYLKRSVLGAYYPQHFGGLVRLLRGDKGKEDCEVGWHLGKGIGIVLFPKGVGKCLYRLRWDDQEGALEFHSGQSLACFPCRLVMVGEGYNPHL